MSVFFDVLNAISGMTQTDMPSAHRLVLLFVANHANATGRSWPSIGLLRNETGYGRTKIAEVLDELVEHGWLRPDGRVPYAGKSVPRFEVLIGRPWGPDSRAQLSRATPDSRVDGPVSEPGPDSSDPRGGSTAIRAAGSSDLEDGGESIRAAGGNTSESIRRAGSSDLISYAQSIRRATPCDPPRDTMRSAARAQTSQEPPIEPPRGGSFALTPTEPNGSEPKKRTRKAPRGPIPSEHMTPSERKVLEVITADPDLVAICREPSWLARDLVGTAPLVDVAQEVRALGAYLRQARKRYTDGNAYLLRNVARKQRETREHQDAAPRPALGPPRDEERPRPPKRPPPVPRAIAEAVERDLAAGVPRPSMAEVMNKLARVGRWCSTHSEPEREVGT